MRRMCVLTKSTLWKSGTQARPKSACRQAPFFRLPFPSCITLDIRKWNSCIALNANWMEGRMGNSVFHVYAHFYSYALLSPHEHF